MIKLIFNRFENADETININLVTQSDTRGLNTIVDTAKKAKSGLEDLNKTGITINTSSINSATKQLDYLQTLVKTLKSNPQVDIKAGISALKDFNVFGTLPKGTQGILSNLANIQSGIKDNTDYTSLQTSLSGVSDIFKSLSLAVNDMNNGLSQTATTSANIDSSTKQLGNDTMSITGEIFKLLGFTKDVEKSAGDVESKFNTIPNSIQSTNTSLKQSTSSANDFKNAMKDAKKSIQSMPSAVQALSDAFKGLEIVRMVYLYRTVKRTATVLIDAVDKAAAYEESLNLYSMAFGKYTERASKWAEEITDKLMLDPSALMQYAGAFFNLAKGMGITSEHAYIMSKNLTQLTYDMASYLNISNEAAQAKIQSAMAGQSRAVASVGVATQVASLQELAYSLNIKKKVSEMTQAEKTYLRYIQLMNSTKQMQGDLGKTMLTPANAIRALKNQLNLLSRAIGQVLTPIIMEALPYLMALTNVLTRAAQSLASALGFQLTDVDFSTTIEDAAGALDDYGKASKKAGKSVSESLAPFDELNNVISESATAGSGSGSGGGGLIDSSLWDKALPQYDMLSKYVDTLKSKAQDLEGTVEKIIGWVTGFLALGVSVKILTGIAKVINALKTIHDAWKSIEVVTSNVIEKMGLAGTVLELVGGALILNDSYDAWYDASKEALMSGKDEPQPSEYLKVAGGAVGAAVGGGAMGAAVGSVVPVIGTAIGGAIGAAIGEFSYWLSLFNESNEAVKEFNKLMDDGYFKIKKDTDELAKWNTTIAQGRSGMFTQLGAELGRLDQYQKWSDRLKEIADATGKVKEGYEGEAAVIVDQLNAGLGMNIKLQDGQIKNYQKISTEIDNAIKKKKAEAVINHYADAYAKSLMDQKDALHRLNKATEDLQKAKQKGFDTSPIEEERNEYNRLKTEYDEANKHYLETMTMKKTYDHAYTAFLKGEYDEVIKTYQNASSKQVEYTKESLMEMTNDVKGGLGEDLVFGWLDLANRSQTEFENALKGMTPEKRELILESIKALEQPAGVIADETGELYGSNLVYSVQDYLNDPNHSLRPKIVLPDRVPADMVKKLQDYATKHSIGIDINADTSPKEILNAFVKYFAKNPLKLMTEFKSGNLNGILGLLKIAKFATGGFPESGDLFFANENGVPEYITSVGNKTAVANQGQMVQVLTNAITAGFQQMGGNRASNITVYVGDKKLYQGQGEYQNRQNDRYGTTVVRI